jgi:hypothetical protein
LITCKHKALTTPWHHDPKVINNHERTTCPMTSSEEPRASHIPHPVADFLKRLGDTANDRRAQAAAWPRASDEAETRLDAASAAEGVAASIQRRFDAIAPWWGVQHLGGNRSPADQAHTGVRGDDPVVKTNEQPSDNSDNTADSGWAALIEPGASSSAEVPVDDEADAPWARPVDDLRGTYGHQGDPPERIDEERAKAWAEMGDPQDGERPHPNSEYRWQDNRLWWDGGIASDGTPYSEEVRVPGLAAAACAAASAAVAATNETDEPRRHRDQEDAAADDAADA